MSIRQEIYVVFLTKTRLFPARALESPSSPRPALNRSSLDSTYLYDLEDRLTSESRGASTITYAWADRGALTRKTVDGVPTDYYTDFLGRITRTICAATSVDWLYTYAPTGDRMKKANLNAPYNSEHYLPSDGDTLCDFTTSGGSEVETGVYVSPGVDGRVARIDPTKGGGDPLRTTYFFGDALQSVLQVTNASGAEIRTQFTDAWGNDIAGVGSGSSGNAGDRFGFTGRENDAESGLMHYRARSYDPAVGRFTSRDPVPFSNLYIYTHNDPVNRVDPLGTEDTRTEDEKEEARWAWWEDGLGWVSNYKEYHTGAELAGSEHSIDKAVGGVGIAAWVVDDASNLASFGVMGLLKKGVKAGLKGIGKKVAKEAIEEGSERAGREVAEQLAKLGVKEGHQLTDDILRKIDFDVDITNLKTGPPAGFSLPDSSGAPKAPTFKRLFQDEVPGPPSAVARADDLAAEGGAEFLGPSSTLRIPASMKSELAAYKKAAAEGTLVRVKSSALPKSKAQRIWEAEFGPAPAGFDVDHVIQRQHGGTDDLTNLQLKASGTNRSEGAKARHLQGSAPYGTYYDDVELAR